MTGTAQTAQTALRVGELAKRAGLTVRTLHHYEAMGLLTPSGRTEAGYRLYSAADVARLGQIVSLRSLGLALDEIRACLTRPDFSLVQAIALHRARVREQIVQLQSLAQTLDGVARLLASHGSGEAATDGLLKLMEVTHMVEKHYTPEQLDFLKQRAEQLGPERIREVEAAWPRLMAEVQAAMDAGTDPADPSVQALARRWNTLVAEFHGGNEGIKQSLNNVYETEWLDRGEFGSSRALWDYVGKAITVIKGEGG